MMRFILMASSVEMVLDRGNGAGERDSQTNFIIRGSTVMRWRL